MLNILVMRLLYWNSQFQIQTDDVSHLLLLNRRNQAVEPTLFAAELEKFKPYQSRLASTVQYEQAALKEITQLWKALRDLAGRGPGARKWEERERRKRETMRRFTHARDVYMEIRDGLAWVNYSCERPLRLILSLIIAKDCNSTMIYLIFVYHFVVTSDHLYRVELQNENKWWRKRRKASDSLARKLHPHWRRNHVALLHLTQRIT